MRRKVLSSILAICMIFSLLPTMALAADTTAPTLSSAAIDGTSLVLTYDETLDESSTPDASDFTVSGIAAGSDVSSVAVSGTTVTLTMANAAVFSDTVTISYTPGTNPIQDEAGNQADSLSGESVTNNTVEPDTTAPTLSSATIDGTSLVLTYDETLDESSTPDASDFTVSGIAAGSDVSSVAVSG
ncbi:SwmB domain-containing protein, partial [uncultured Intestinimonas sp.]|uniref:SwmB domain-containing protein n=1 Tax=uncultured Intestinimonas sp. TaxID=1689265 RepID=UPI0025D2D22E